MTVSNEDQRSSQRRVGLGCIILILLPFILFMIPIPETPLMAYPVIGKSGFDVLKHHVSLSLGAFEQSEQSEYGIKRRFCVWADVPNERSEAEPVTIKNSKLEYRIDEGPWHEADRTPEGDYKGGGSARTWYWSPLIQDLELIDPSSKGYKMRRGRYDLKLEFEAADGTKQTVETTLILSEKKVRHWTSIRKILEDLSGIT